jgi:hypothetical protein
MVLIFLSFECAYDQEHETGDKNPRKYLVEKQIPHRNGKSGARPVQQE